MQIINDTIKIISGLSVTLISTPYCGPGLPAGGGLWFWYGVKRRLEVWRIRRKQRGDVWPGTPQ